MVAIRPATVDDTAAIRDVADAAWWDTYPGTLDSDQIREALDTLYDPAFLETVLEDRGDLLFVVAERDEEIVGFASAQQTFADEVELYTLFVHPDHQSEGVGSELLASILESARSAGVERVRTGVLSGNRAARSFFEGHDFERVETLTSEVGGSDHPEDIFERPVESV